MSCITSFNSACNTTEYFLTATAAIPFIGTLFAVCKFTFGLVQTITALALGILSTPFRFCNEDAMAFNNHCWTHVVHGLGNMIASLGEAIPILGTILVMARLNGYYAGGLPGYNPEEQEKYIPYSDVIQENLSNLGGSARSRHLYYNTEEPLCLSPTHFRQATGFNAIITPLN